MPHLHLYILGSGSKGNCALVEGPCGLIMIDDGFSRREVLKRMDALHLHAEDVAALILTHEHSDHVSGLSVWCNRWDGPLFASTGTPETSKYLAALPFEEFDPGDAIEVAGVRIETFSNTHDVVNPVGFRFSTADDAIGFATDTGTLSDQAMELLSDARILALESNHDVQMLRTGSYPRYLQDRILSDHGHLSNAQAATAACGLVTNRTERLVAMHISQENNTPTTAVKALATALGATPDNDICSTATLERPTTQLKIQPASQYNPTTIE